ncbi:hypothetical protein FB99_47060 (plasmid) [Pantoea agglomerans]|nr:hypothetical protein FB99_47060 [Pantoea agglomerans]
MGNSRKHAGAARPEKSGRLTAERKVAERAAQAPEIISA